MQKKGKCSTFIIPQQRCESSSILTHKEIHALSIQQYIPRMNTATNSFLSVGSCQFCWCSVRFNIICKTINQSDQVNTIYRQYIDLCLYRFVKDLCSYRNVDCCYFFSVFCLLIMIGIFMVGIVCAYGLIRVVYSSRTPSIYLIDIWIGQEYGSPAKT